VRLGREQPTILQDVLARSITIIARLGEATGQSRPNQAPIADRAFASARIHGSNARRTDRERPTLIHLVPELTDRVAKKPLDPK
jgi:hypothetical protein